MYNIIYNIIYNKNDTYNTYNTNDNKIDNKIEDKKIEEDKKKKNEGIKILIDAEKYRFQECHGGC